MKELTNKQQQILTHLNPSHANLAICHIMYAEMKERMLKIPVSSVMHLESLFQELEELESLMSEVHQLIH